MLKGSKTSKSASEVTKAAGIDKLMPGAVINDWLFDPCGYSLNALDGTTHYTIHITPEPHCSFVSFGTNKRLTHYTPLIKQVLACFKPGKIHSLHPLNSNSSILIVKIIITWSSLKLMTIYFILSLSLSLSHLFVTGRFTCTLFADEGAVRSEVVETPFVTDEGAHLLVSRGPDDREPSVFHRYAEYFNHEIVKTIVIAWTMNDVSTHNVYPLSALLGHLHPTQGSGACILAEWLIGL
jgi:hypothetical protein